MADCPHRPYLSLYAARMAYRRTRTSTRKITSAEYRTAIHRCTTCSAWHVDEAA